jgi:hypothetical protein
MGRLTLFVALIVWCASPAWAATDVTVRVPVGLSVTGFIDTEPGPKDGAKWVVVSDLVIVNPSARFSQAFTLDDFRLTAPDGTIYLPKARPGYALDLSDGMVLGPSQRYRANVVFLVPEALHRGDFSFLPKNWQDDLGHPIVYCCLYYS